MFAFKNQLSKITSKKLKIEELEGLKKNLDEQGLKKTLLQFDMIISDQII